MGLDDRFWEPITAAEVRAVLGVDAGIAAGYRRWLFAVARCSTPDGDVYLKRQPPMGREIGQLRWQHRLTNHLADHGIPAARALGLVEHEGLWYELHEPARGSDVYADADSWDPFECTDHAGSAGAMLARLHRAGADFEPMEPQPQAGFVVQLGMIALSPVGAVTAIACARPAVAEYLDRAAGWESEVTEAYDQPFDRLRPLLGELPATPLHGDWQTNNLFFDGDRVAGVIDFHQADCGPRVLDLAVAVERNCFFWNRISAGDDTALTLDHANRLVGAYHRESPLTGAERAAFPDVLGVCQFEYGISFLDYYWGVERDLEKADWAWRAFVLGHGRWWAGRAGRIVRGEIERVVAELD